MNTYICISQTLQFEYASSNRSTCKGCKIKLEKNELRIGNEQKYGEHTITAWRHLECFNINPKYKDVDPKQIPGFNFLKRNDKEKIISFFDGGGKKKTAKETAQDLLDSAEKEDKLQEQGTKPSKKNRNLSDEENGNESQKSKQGSGKKIEIKGKGGPILGYTTAELQKFNEHVAFFEKKTSEYLKGLLSINCQPKSGSKNDLVLKCADGKTKGSIPVCKTCGGGKLRFDFQTGIYKCPGYMDDDIYTRCGRIYTLHQVIRDPWVDDVI